MILSLEVYELKIVGMVKVGNGRMDLTDGKQRIYIPHQEAQGLEHIFNEMSNSENALPAFKENSSLVGQ